MDFGAYMQIERLEPIAQANGIHINRLRGYRLMCDVKPFSTQKISEIKGKIDDRESQIYADAQYALWNQFAGKENVLYIHARIGKDYLYYKNEPWFLGGVIDCFDPTYCDIYARIDQNPILDK